MAHGQGHSVDEYLETIYFLAFPIGEYRPRHRRRRIASRVAEMLGVSRASAGEMLKRLEAEGLVERGEQKEAILTRSGIVRAERVVRKHRLIERFLTDFMGYTAAESHVHADELGDTFRDDMVERIDGGSATPTAARTAGPSTRRRAGREPRARAALRPEPGERRDRAPRRARRRPVALVLRPGAGAGTSRSCGASRRRPVHRRVGGAERAIGEKAARPLRAARRVDATPGSDGAGPRDRRRRGAHQPCRCAPT